MFTTHTDDANAALIDPAGPQVKRPMPPPGTRGRTQAKG
jgi:hypothetical protein